MSVGRLVDEAARDEANGALHGLQTGTVFMFLSYYYWSITRGHCHITGGWGTATIQGGQRPLTGEHRHITGGSLPHYRGVTATLQGRHWHI